MTIWHIHSTSFYHPYYNGRFYEDGVFSNLAIAAHIAMTLANEISTELTRRWNDLPKESYCTFNVEKTSNGYDVEIFRHFMKSKDVRREVVVKITKMNVY